MKQADRFDGVCAQVLIFGFFSQRTNHVWANELPSYCSLGGGTSDGSDGRCSRGMSKKEVHKNKNTFHLEDKTESLNSTFKGNS